MRSRPSLAFRPRRLLAVAGLVSLGTGLLLATAAAPSAGAAASAGAATTGTSHAPVPAKPSRASIKEAAAQAKQLAAAARTVAVAHSSTTVQGPRMYNPLTGKSFPDPSTVTVTQTTNLVNQQIQVSWTNFTPSTALVYNNENVAYPVMVAECRGTDPASPADCYGAQNGGVTSTSGKYGPMNAAYATTTPQGTGLTDIDILTKEENHFLGCLSTKQCSLAIVPAQGGNFSVPPGKPPNCKDHSQDFFFGTGSAIGSESFGSAHFSCSWAQRIVVPLTFARTPNSCPFRNSAFTVAGSPMMDRAMNSWIAALCVGSHGLTIAYTSTLGEPAALGER